MKQVEADDVTAALAKAPIFASMRPADRDELARRCRVVTLTTRQQLWGQNRKAEYLGVVLAGRLKVTRDQRDREMIIDVAGPGDLLGEISLTLNAAYQYDVKCLRRARVALVPARDVRELLERQPRAAVALAIDLAQQVLRLTRRLEAMGAGDVEHRLARVMLGLVDRFGSDFPGGILVPLKLRREDLASLAATTLETTSRRLSKWKARGIVVPQPVGYLVKDVAALRRMVDG